MKKTNKKGVSSHTGSEKQVINQPVVFRAPIHIVHAPSQQVVEQATEYVENRFGRALVRLSDR